MFGRLNVTWAYALAGTLGYLLGCFNTAYILGLIRGQDIRKKGSHNAGASNAFITFGALSGLIAAVTDIFKAVAAVALADGLFPQLEFGGVLAGVCCILGHAFPVWMGFRGGKGFASYLGLILAASGWPAFGGAILLTALITLIGDRIVFATLSVLVLYPLFMARHDFSVFEVTIVAILSLVLIAKHHENFARLARGEELGIRQVRRLKKAQQEKEDEA